MTILDAYCTGWNKLDRLAAQNFGHAILLNLAADSRPTKRTGCAACCSLLRGKVILAGWM